MPKGHQLDPHRGERLGQCAAAPTFLKLQQGQPDRLQEGIETLAVEIDRFLGCTARPLLSLRLQHPQHGADVGLQQPFPRLGIRLVDEGAQSLGKRLRAVVKR